MLHLGAGESNLVARANQRHQAAAREGAPLDLDEGLRERQRFAAGFRVAAFFGEQWRQRETRGRGPRRGIRLGTPFRFGAEQRL